MSAWGQAGKERGTLCTSDNHCNICNEGRWRSSSAVHTAVPRLVGLGSPVRRLFPSFHSPYDYTHLFL